MARPVALVTGASRGIGAATALALADRGFDVAITYREKKSRADEVVAELATRGARGLSLACNLTQAEDIARLFGALRTWSDRLDLLVLNASGGLERDLVAADPSYPLRLNRDAQLALVDGALPLMEAGSSVIYVTSHWAHLHGQADYPPVYTPVAETKHAGETALRAQQAELAVHGVRLLVVTGDLIEGTITPRLLERTVPGLFAQRRAAAGRLPTATDMGLAIAEAATDRTLPAGETVVVGGALESVPRRQDAASREQS